MFSTAGLIALTVLLHLQSFGAGEVDALFNPYLGNVPAGVIYKTLVQPDGKVIVAGEFGIVNGVAKPNLVRFNADGTIDPTFNPPAIYSIGASFPIQGMALQPDGKILISGLLTAPRSAIARLNPDGSPDTAFNSSPALNNLWYANDVKIAPDGKIVVYALRQFAQSPLGYLIRLNTDGSLDTERQVDVTKHNIQADGKIIVIFYSIVRRLNVDMSDDGSFTSVSANNTITEIIIQPDGKVLICGSFTQINGGSLFNVARINTNGTIDVSFNVNNAAAGGLPVRALLYLPSGKILVGGNFSFYNGVMKPRLVLINSDGSVDVSFTATNNFASLYDLALQPDGKIVAGGEVTQTGGHYATARFNADGARDMSFQPLIGSFGTGSKIVFQPDGKILIGGVFNYVNGSEKKSLVRFNADGTLDSAFNTNTNLFLYGVQTFDLLPDGKVLAGDTNVLRRLNSNGTPDITYASDGNFGAVYEIKALSDGRALIAKGNKLYRYSVAGTIDSSFNVTAAGEIFKIALQPDGKILICGNFGGVNSTVRGRFARLNADGTVDSTFNPPGGASGNFGWVKDITLQADGKVIIGGDFTGVNFDNNRKYLARLNSDGTLDTGFTQALNNSVYTVKPQPDGKVLIGGLFSTVDGISRQKYARLNSNGSLDPSFDVDSGANQNVADIELQSDNKIMMVGAFSTINGTVHAGVVRLLNPPSVNRTAFDYDGDGKADVSVYRPSTNRWYVFKSSDSTVSETTFGIAGDVPVPADFDGDGKTDLAIFRPSSGDWWSLSSLNGAQIFAHWGANGDIPRPSDFDGDGRMDYIVFRPSDNFWYRISSANGASSNGAFGLAGDKPVTGDFDGDGKSDKAIYRPSAGTWWYQSSINGAQLAVQWGISTDVPAPADFDGDGKTDFAVYRPSTGVWYVINSSNGSFLIMAFGIAEDKPVPADYDGDGKADIAVFRPSTGTWYQMKTTAGFSAQQFGISTDIPTENAFVP